MSGAELDAVFELERLMHRAAAGRFEGVGCGFVAASPSLPAVWDASLLQLEPGAVVPPLEEALELAELPARWYPDLGHRSIFIGCEGDRADGRELALSLARRSWDVIELALMITREPPAARGGLARAIGGQAMRRIKGRLGVEQGLPPRAIAQFDRYDELRERIAARNVFAGVDAAGNPGSIADAYLRGDIAVIEDVATLRRQRGRGLGSAAVCAATAKVLALGARAVALFSEPALATGFYAPLGFERIGTAYDCKLVPSGAGPPRRH